MTKEELLAKLSAKKEMSEAVLNVKKAEDTVANIDGKEVKAPVAKADGVQGLDSELPTQKDVEKEVAKDEGPMIPVNNDGESKNGGESDKLEDGKVEAEKKKEDNGMKDVINVSERKVEEAAEVSSELLSQLKEAAAREEGYKKTIAEIKAQCESVIKKQAVELTNAHAAEMKKIFESVTAEGEKLEREMTEAAAKNEKMYNSAKKLYESSAKMNKILLKAVKESAAKKKMVRFVTPEKRAVESIG